MNIVKNQLIKDEKETLSWMKQKLESRFLGEIPIISDMQMTPSLRQKVKKNYRAF